MADIRIKDLPANVAPSPSQFVGTDLATTQKLTIQALVDTGAPVASQAEAESGVNNVKRMTPLTTKQAIAAQSTTIEQVDEVIAIASALSPTTANSFTVSLGDTSVAISGGYQVGKVSEVFLSGVRITGWSAVDGDNVTFPAITTEDLGGETTADLVVMVGLPTTGFSGMDSRYLVLKTGQELKGISLDRFGSWGNNTKDHTKILQDAANSGENIFIPPLDAAGGQKWNVEEPSEWLSDVTVSGAGDNSKIKLMRASGDRACPVFIAKEGGGNISFQDFQIDGNGANLINPSDTDQFMVVYGSAFIVCAEETHIQNVTVRNGWDCGIVLIATRNGTGTAGYPNDCRIYNTKTFNNGCGYHVLGGPGYIGSGINNGSGARLQVIGCFDKGSRGAVTVDDGGGASGFALGCISLLNAGDDSVGTAPTPGGQGSGTAFYSGNPDWSFDTCKAYFPWKHGFWLAAPGGMQARNCEVIGAREHGFYLTGGGHAVSDCRAKNVSQKTDNTYSGFFVDTPFGSSLENLISDCECVYDTAIPNKPLYGYQEYSYSGNIPGSRISGGKMNGKTAGIGPTLTQTSVDMVTANGVLTFYSPVSGPGVLPGGAIYRDGSGFLKTV